MSGNFSSPAFYVSSEAFVNKLTLRSRVADEACGRVKNQAKSGKGNFWETVIALNYERFLEFHRISAFDCDFKKISSDSRLKSKSLRLLKQLRSFSFSGKFLETQSELIVSQSQTRSPTSPGFFREQSFIILPLESTTLFDFHLSVKRREKVLQLICIRRGKIAIRFRETKVLCRKINYESNSSRSWLCDGSQ